MKSNGDGGIFVGWGMSIASKRAKERQNRTPDELVMYKTVKWERLKLQGSDVRGKGRMSGTLYPEKNTRSKSNKSQKIWGYFWWGFSDFRMKSSKTRLENGGGDSKFVINVAHDTKMM